MTVDTQLIIYGVIAYFIGNISPSIIIGRLNGVDVKKEGSGNAGTTNTLRLLGVKAAVVTLIIDILKGYIAVRMGLNAMGDLGAMVCFVCVVYGHIFPILFKFKGGKGVATSLGAAFAVDWLSAFALFLIAVFITGTTRKMSLGSIIAAICYPFLVMFYYPDILPASIILACTVVIKHHANIGRLIRREEPSIHFGSRSSNESETEENNAAEEVLPDVDILARRMTTESDQHAVIEGKAERQIINEIVEDEFSSPVKEFSEEPTAPVETIETVRPKESKPVSAPKKRTKKPKDDRKHIIISDASGNPLIHIAAKEIKEYRYKIEQKG